MRRLTTLVATLRDLATLWTALIFQVNEWSRQALKRAIDDAS